MRFPTSRPRRIIRRTGISALTTIGLLLAAATAASASPYGGPTPVSPGVVTASSMATPGDALTGTPPPSSETEPGPGAAPDLPEPDPSPDTLLPPGTAIEGPAPAPELATGTPKTYQVYATREGLTGHTTANGHVIVAKDHFVSLPSWHVLSAKGRNDYSVRVCAVGNGRCVYEPVWDVGPWNTHDDYWAAGRTEYPDLPRGKPEAQAAYQDNYHSGKDQFGREVANPAGIDLANGTITDGLGYASSAWVNVTFLWTGGGLRGDVSTDGSVLHVRSGPSTSNAIVGLAGPHARLPIECSRTGTSITHSSTTDIWYRLGPANYVSAAYVDVPNPSKINSCS